MNGPDITLSNNGVQVKAVQDSFMTIRGGDSAQ